MRACGEEKNLKVIHNNNLTNLRNGWYDVKLSNNLQVDVVMIILKLVQYTNVINNI